MAVSSVCCTFCFLQSFRIGKKLRFRIPNCSSSVISYQQSALRYRLLLCKKYTETKALNLNSSEKNNGTRSLTEQLFQAKISSGKLSNDFYENRKRLSEQKEKEDYYKKKAMKYTFIMFGTMFTGIVSFLIYDWGSPEVDDNGNEVVDEFSKMPVIKQYILRTYREVMYYNKLIRDPSSPKLLPDPLEEPYIQPPYTLVLEMTDVLVHPDWTYRTGWRFKKRPGVDYFLQQVSHPLFEVVIYTAEQGFTAFPILDALDPHGNIMYRLFRGATRYVDGHHIKDLSCLNRDLSKVIIIDCDPKSFSLQPHNAILLKKWLGDNEDRTLYDLASLLRTIATNEIEDVRTVLEYYGQFDDPIYAYKENKKKLQEEEKKLFQGKHEKSSFLSVFTSGLRGNR